MSRVGGREDGYGAWEIARGSVNANSVVYSVGIGDDISFDLALIEETGATVHAFDPTPESLEWLGEQPSVPEEFVVHPIALAAQDGEVNFFPHANEDWVAHSILNGSHTSADAVLVPAKRLSTMMADLNHTRVDLLKIDIEGAEYEVIDDILRSGAEVRQLLVEFHHRFPEIGLDRTRRSVAALRDAGYNLFYVSPLGEELGFILP